MRLAQINLPTHDNAGMPLAAETDTLRNLLLDSFGGFTESNAQGAWRDDSGKLYAEPVTVFSVAMDATPANDATLRAIAARMARDARQVCVFMVSTAGEVHFVEPETAPA